MAVVLGWGADVWTGIAVGVASLVIGLIAWRFPRHPRKAPPTAGGARVGASAGDGDLVLETSHHLPVYDLPGGGQKPGEWLIAVTLYNRGPRPVCVSSWGVRVPSGDNIVALAPVTQFEPRLPHWIQPGTNGTWYMEADEVRRIAAERGIAFDGMVAWVSLADGRRITAPKGLPLK
jgi:hypothetical protein